MSSGNTELVSDATANSDDLLIEILVRLPLKSLIRFKSVSKHWQSLISSPQFSFRLYPDSHLVTGLILLRSSGLLNPEHDFLPLKNETTSTPIKCDTFLNHPSGLRILQSCGGLLCCSSLHDRKFQRDFYIYNPTTKQFVMLPRPSAKIYGINIAYDHARSPYYKVVCVRGSDSLEGIMNDHFSYQIEIYSSETRSWRISGDPFVAHASMLFENGVYWNGSIHWINCYDSLYFNVDEERLRAMPMPPTPIPDNWRFPRNLRYFGESREHFHVVEIHGPCATKLDVYEMERDYSRWFVKYRVDLDAITVAFPEMISSILSPADMDYYRFSILCIVREANDAESYMVLHIPGQYNIGSVRYLASLVEWLDAYQYIETLARV